MFNLLTNALKFTPKEGRVHVTIERVNSHVEISVTDNGAGIAPEDLLGIFERFRQVDASTTRQHRGLGIGLSIELVRRLRGLPEGMGVPAVALTALARAEDRTRALRAGFQMHIAKPVDSAELVAVVKNLATLQRRI